MDKQSIINYKKGSIRQFMNFLIKVKQESIGRQENYKTC